MDKLSRLLVYFFGYLRRNWIGESFCFDLCSVGRFSLSWLLGTIAAFSFLCCSNFSRNASVCCLKESTIPFNFCFSFTDSGWRCAPCFFKVLETSRCNRL